MASQVGSSYSARKNIHYDGRFTRDILSEEDQKNTIRLLVKTYLNTVRELGVQTWLMHGSLLGWWWGKKVSLSYPLVSGRGVDGDPQVMPWDLDADVQVTEQDMYFLAAYYNMTTYYYEGDEMPKGRTYLLDVNPHHEHREMDDVLNVIDARWIDTTTGLFIDITSARYALDHPQGEGILYDKHAHEFRDTYLYPLLETTFEGAPVKIPFGYKKMLESEYGEKALTNTRFHG